MKNALLSLFFGVFMSSVYAQTGWLQVNSFGTNPGNLLMYRYVPANIPANAPLVVVLHGCTQNATNYAAYSGWDTLANHHKFYVIHAEQQSLNNFNLCFNWFLPTDFHRGQGESGSVAQMVDYMKSQYSIDNTKVFVTGLSAGACLTTVMLGAYPDVFSAGAIMAGTPYKSATDATSAMNAMNGLVSKTAAQWGDSVRKENPTYTGDYPKVAIFQGTSDLTVNQANATELVKQWTNVQNTDQVADSVNSSYNGNSSVVMKQYNNASGKTVVQSYLITNMQHGIAVDPGTCFQQGGTTGFNSYSFDEGFFSTFWAAEFFGIIQNPYPITGQITVNYGQTNIIYSVPTHAGSSYQWSFPAGVTIVSGQGTNQILVNWGTISGLISVTETETGSCVVGPVDLYVTASNNSGIENSSTGVSDVTIFQNQTENSIHVLTSLNSYSIEIYSLTGKVVLTTAKCSKNAVISLPESIKSGVYIIKVMAPNTVFTKKITLL